jgi:alkanesulfonate monooxygenase SsuD/methylene tetrahydromethanopterin reductase-like flavin-dependent oxidoreductase (luciferase family)
VKTAADVGHTVLAANDHLVWRRPWLDGMTTLAAVSEQSGSMALATTIALPTVRNPVVVAKSLSTLAVLTGARVIAGLGPGSSQADYRAVGVPFDERWARFDEALPLVRALVRGQPPTAGRYYDATGVQLDPLPAEPPAIWFGSWGSDRRLAAMAGVADGWLASGYNTTPADFSEARARLDDHLRAAGRDPSGFPDTIATMWLYVSDDRRAAEQVRDEILAPTLQRPPVELAARLPVGSPEHCARVLTDYASAGAQRVLLWPVKDPIGQLEAFEMYVRPAVDA